jgi:hydroxymethylbilane synthase
MTTELRIATRRSRLAIAQAQRVGERLRAVGGEDIQIRLVEIDSSGDVDRASPVASLTEMGAFVRAVQGAVLGGRADAAVHSLKDLPTAGLEGLVTAAYPERESPRDAVVGSRLDDLPHAAVVGTGSPRRRAQLQVLRPDLRTAELRGNVDTRLRKVTSGEVAAAILAEAGLHRLGREDLIAQVLTIDEMTPAPGQGVLAVETRIDGWARDVVEAVDDPDLRPLVETERTLLAETGAGCRSALGAVATWHDGEIRLDAFIDDDRGPRRVTVTGLTPEEAVSSARKELDL